MLSPNIHVRVQFVKVYSFLVVIFVCVLKANDTAPDIIQSKGKHMPVERSLSEEQCKFLLILSSFLIEIVHNYLYLTY